MIYLLDVKTYEIVTEHNEHYFDEVPVAFTTCNLTANAVNVVPRITNELAAKIGKHTEEYIEIIVFVTATSSKQLKRYDEMFNKYNFDGFVLRGSKKDETRIYEHFLTAMAQVNRAIATLNNPQTTEDVQ